jgi:hypothetical protein
MPGHKRRLVASEEVTMTRRREEEWPTGTLAQIAGHSGALTGRELREQRAGQVQEAVKFLAVRAGGEAETDLAEHILGCRERGDCRDCGWTDGEGYHPGALAERAWPTLSPATVILRAGPEASALERMHGRSV